ncbi:acyltransferase family protein [Gilliamella intestini]|uniref:acyltransferase family protein n=1 Tax=Gilliamella intestini TaxID=1798183 RepID=UPI001428A017
MRGISAIFVFISHSLLSWRYFFVDGGWINNTPLLIFDKNLNEQIEIGFLSLGGIGVSFFFMITGFLFFDQLLRNKGKINIIQFFIKRFFRIAPLYYSVITLVFITVFFNRDS